MKKLNLIISLLVLLNLSGCNSEDDNVENIRKNGTLIFGWFADSSCSGGCSTIYKIDNGKIYKDIDYDYPVNTFFEGNFQLMTNEDYLDFQALLVDLPNEIFNEPNGYLDCTDCTIANGGFYLEFQNDTGFHKSWRFHNKFHPDYIENYRKLLLNKLAELN